MAKVEVVRAYGREPGWNVEICYREPFEDLFEIAVHVSRFENIWDANRLAERVRAAVKGVYPKSPACALDATQWVYRSSAYRSLAQMASDNPAPAFVPTSEAAKRAAMYYD